jgi:hypothetical protein
MYLLGIQIKPSIRENTTYGIKMQYSSDWEIPDLELTRTKSDLFFSRMTKGVVKGILT